MLQKKTIKESNTKQYFGAWLRYIFILKRFDLIWNFHVNEYCATYLQKSKWQSDDWLLDFAFEKMEGLDGFNLGTPPPKGISNELKDKFTMGGLLRILLAFFLFLFS